MFDLCEQNSDDGWGVVLMDLLMLLIMLLHYGMLKSYGLAVVTLFLFITGDIINQSHLHNRVIRYAGC